MNYTRFSSKLLEAAVEEFARLPGIGHKTALRLVLHLLRQDKEVVNTFGTTIIQLRNEIMHCKICQNISDAEICNICSDKARDKTLICVVENVKDVISVSTTMEGDTTSFYLYRKFKDHHVLISTIARGVSIGDELEYTDEITLGRSIANRTPFKPTLT